ncbi:MAG: hypothetical protein ACOYWZ_04445, partial [Bacillota bacterium]
KDFDDRNLGCCGGDGCPYYHTYGFEDVEDYFEDAEDHDDCLKKWISYQLEKIEKETIKDMIIYIEEYLEKKIGGEIK